MGVRTAKHEKEINLALQGGGAHGAFTWGVLDKIFEDGRLWITAISGTSAGAMNAVVAAMGMYESGGEGARTELERFWRAISEAGALSPFKPTPLDQLMGEWSLDNSPGYLWMDLLNRLASPYDINPLKLNPFRDMVREFIDFEKVRGAEAMEIFISATNVETGRARVFSRDEIDLDVVMASACLPFMYHAVEIDGEYFWDGGYMGNPVLLPFFDDENAGDDTLIVQINPIERPGEPRTARDILNRVNEITFNASLMKELRMIHLIDRSVDCGHTELRRTRMNIHMIEASEAMQALSASSKLNTDWAFLTHLRDIGREAAERWIKAHYRSIGKRSTLNIGKLFEGLAPKKKHVPKDH